MTLVYMFPGQSSRYPGMHAKLAGLDRCAAEVLEAASEILGRDLASHFRKDNDEAYACNTDIQVGVFVANHMFLRILEEAGLRATASLGLSLGEWNHLVHIGALPFDEALRAVQQRGEAYDAGPRGAMASVFPITLEELTEVAQRASDKGLVEVVNLNSPRQQVLSGETAGIDEALRILEEEHYVEARIIERRVPMHASSFAPVGARFGDYLGSQVTFREPTLPYLPNRLAELLETPEPTRMVELLSTHVHRPVLWRRSVDLVLERWPDATLVEVGPRTVLYNLLDRKWHRGVSKRHTDTLEDTAPHLARLIEELSCSKT